MRGKISTSVIGLSRQPSKESNATILVRDMYLARLMIHVQQVEKAKLKDT